MNLGKLINRVLKPAKIVDNETNLNLEKDLNSLLAEEFQAWYQYISVKEFLSGEGKEKVAKKFNDFGKEELDDHAMKLIKRIADLQFECYLATPESWADESTSKFEVADLDVISQLETNINAETLAIGHYTLVIEKTSDKETVDLLNHLLADEEKHLKELNELLTELKDGKKDS